MNLQTLEPWSKVAAETVLQSQGRLRHDVPDCLSDPRWQLAQRIAASSSLGRSRLMSRFLLYVVDRHIRHCGDEITEQQIGVLVFGRSPGYDSNEDNIVRSYARNLRKRIDEYFATEGIGETLLLEIPRGGYTPTFSVRTTEPISRLQQIPLTERVQEEYSTTEAAISVRPEVEVISEPERPGSRERHPTDELRRNDTDAAFSKGTGPFHRYTVAFALCVGMVLGVCAAVFIPFKQARRTLVAPAEAESDLLWRQIFSRDRDTFIVPSDDGLVIMQGLTIRPVPLDSYINGSYRASIKTDGVPGASEILKLGGRRYTSVADLDFVARLAQLDEVVPGRMMIRYARDLSIDDLRNGNAILIGSVEANPWIELFQSQMNFRFSIHPGTDQPSGIVNLHPKPGESTLYGTPGPDHTYGLIAYVPNLERTGHVLIVGGLNTAGTQAASRFLLSPTLMLPILRRAKESQGGLRPFELLIGADNIAANASVPQLVLERIAPS